MRITNNTLRMAFLGALEQAQQRILKTQTQVSTGLRVNQPSDDPFAAARIGELGAALTKLDQYQTNADAARHRLGLEEEALVALGNDLQRVRELTVQGNSDSLGNADRAAIAAELRQRLESLIGVANASDAAGNYLFAGYRETTLPFLSTPSGIVYAGDSGQRLVQISDNRFVAVNDSGEKVFQRIPSGNGTFVLAAAPGNTGTGVLGRGSVSDPAAYVADSYSIDFLTPTDY
jgi:flagellar hook-associated protein 3 FlgL